jgi:hypothetical protein
MKVHGERLIQDTTTNPKSRSGLLPSHVRERCRGVGKGGEVAIGNSYSGSPSNLPSVVACNLSISLFWIAASVRHEIKSDGVYIAVFRSRVVHSHQERCKRSQGALDGLHHVAWSAARMVSPFLGL